MARSAASFRSVAKISQSLHGNLASYALSAVGYRVIMNLSNLAVTDLTSDYFFIAIV
jgi:hypothetical protein